MGLQTENYSSRIRQRFPDCIKGYNVKRFGISRVKRVFKLSIEIGTYNDAQCFLITYTCGLSNSSNVARDMARHTNTAKYGNTANYGNCWLQTTQTPAQN